MSEQLEELEVTDLENDSLSDSQDEGQLLPDESENQDPPTDEESPPPAPLAVDGVLVSEVQARLSHNLYQQLSDGSEEFVLEAMKRAKVELSSVLDWLNVFLDLEVPVQREAFLHLTVYHLHLALGHEDEGTEYRAMAKSLIANAYGNYPAESAPSAPSGGVVLSSVNPRHGQLARARGL